MAIATFKASKNVDVTIGLALGGLAATLAAELDLIDPDTFASKPIPRTDGGGAAMRTWTITGANTAAVATSFKLIVTPATIAGPATINATLQVRQGGNDLTGTDEGGTPLKSPWVNAISATTASAIEFNVDFS